MENLPRNSAYARHRRACLGKALMLLESQRWGPCTSACIFHLSACLQPEACAGCTGRRKSNSSWSSSWTT